LSEEFATVSEIKQYVYCPRTVYYSSVLKADVKLSSQQWEGRVIHDEIYKKDKRRVGSIVKIKEFLGAKKLFGLNLESEKLRLRGTLDCLIIKDNEHIPVDYKSMKSNKKKVWLDHKVQIAAYSLLVEEEFLTTVKRAFVYYEPEGLAVKVAITPSLRRLTSMIIKEVLKIKEEEYMPKRTIDERKCKGGCGYLWICKMA
jgi:CRISPR-associated exonuclease Cas4